MRALLLGALLAACGSDAPDCEFEGTAYLTTFSERSGDCGPLDPQLSIPGAAITGQSCSTTTTHGTDCASVTAQRDCTISDTITHQPVGTRFVRYSLMRAGNGADLSGLLDVTVTVTNGERCHSIYGVTLVRQ